MSGGILSAVLVCAAFGASAQTIPTTPTTIRGIFTPSPQTVPTSGGGTANVTFNPVTANGTGTVVGNVVQNGITTAVSCSYDVVTNTVSGGAACNQILSGANLQNFTRAIVGSRLGVVSDVMAAADQRITQNVFERRLVNDLIIRVQGDSQASPGSGGSSASFGDSVGSFGTAGAGWFDDDRLGQQKDGDNLIVTAGLDKAVGKILFGGTLGYLKTTIDLESLNGELESKGWIGGAYVGVLLSDVLSVTAAATYVGSNVDVLRTSGGTQIRSEYDQTEWSGSVTANAFKRVGDLGLTGTTGITYGDWKTDAYTESTGLAYGAATDNTWTGRVGGVLSLFTTTGLTPYAAATYNHLLSDRNFGQDRGSLDLSGGLSYAFGSAVGSLEVTKTFMKKDEDNTVIGLHVRFIL